MKKSELTEWLDERRDRAETVTRCVLCPETFAGTALEGREWFAEHRLAHVDELERRKAERRAAEARAAAEERARQQKDREATRRIRRAASVDPKRRAARPSGRGPGTRACLIPASEMTTIRDRNASGETVSSIARESWQRWGYSSAASAAAALSREFSKNGWKLASRPRRPAKPAPDPDGPRNERARLYGPRRAAVLDLSRVGRLSVTEIARLAWQPYGFATETSAYVSIRAYLLTEGPLTKRRPGDLAELGRTEALRIILDGVARPQLPIPENLLVNDEGIESPRDPVPVQEVGIEARRSPVDSHAPNVIREVNPVDLDHRVEREEPRRTGQRRADGRDLRDELLDRLG